MIPFPLVSFSKPQRDDACRLLCPKGKHIEVLSGPQAWLSFRAPGYGADAQVDLRTGAYTLSLTEAGLVAALNDLHKGRDTPGAYRWAIDLSALFLALVSLTGLLLSLFLRKTRRPALLTLLLGLLLFGGLALWASL